MTPLLIALLLSASSRDVRDEQADVTERLENERAAFEALQSEKADVLVLLDVFERQARASTEAAAGLELASRALKPRLDRARAEEEEVTRALQQRQQALAPRLTALYRLRRQNRFSLLVSAAGFADLVRRERAMGTLLEADLRELTALQQLGDYARLQAGRLERLERQSDELRIALTTEQDLAKGRRARFDDLVRTLSAESNRSSRVVRDLERAEAELSQMVGEMGNSGDSGFRGRKGRLPFPTSGIVEVGFGKVVNPRFNTVTVQKGIDIRAGEGSRVFSVGVGTVVYSGWLKGYGNLVIVDHGSSYHSLYAHLKNRLVEVENEVEEGEEIGSVGDTGSLKGPYLYFEIRKGGQAVDPLPWLEASPE